MIDKKITDLVKKILKSGRMACLTGSGISADSGIPTFRGKGGLWEKYDPSIYANIEGLVSILRTHPDKAADFIVDFYSALLEAHPNPAHFVLSVLEREHALSATITQNIDNLHQESGSRNVIELHGNALRIRCAKCLKRVTLEKDRLKEMVELFKINRNSQIKLLKIISRYFPRCACGGRHRIDIVLFGEALPEDQLYKAYQQLDDCDLFLLIGTSLAVYPAANLPIYAKEKGAKLIEINAEPSALSYLCDYKIMGKASEILPQLFNIAR